MTKKLYIPLQFWFNRNPGLALPLIALQYHEVKILIEFEKKENINFMLSGRENGENAVANGELSGEEIIRDIISVNSINDGLACGEHFEKGNINDLLGYKSCSTEISNVSLFCDYIFLDTDERRRFAQVSHEYLIDQLQVSRESVCINNSKSSKSGVSHNIINIPIEFNHPVKALYWVIQNNQYRGTYNFTPSDIGNGSIGVESIKEFLLKSKIQLNGNDRIKWRDGSYFRLVQPYQSVGSAPNQAMISSSLEKICTEQILLGEAESRWGRRVRGGWGYPGITKVAPNTETTNSCILNKFLANPEYGYMYMYSFALKPMEHQPSGTCNFSRIDNATLLLDIDNHIDNECNDIDIRVYANNYNVLRIMSGMGGLAYSN
jgi:hypothetical protein